MRAISIVIDCEAILRSGLADQVGQEVVGLAGDAVGRGKALRAADRASDAGVIGGEEVALTALAALVRREGQGARIADEQRGQHRTDYVSQYHIYSDYY